MLYKTLGAPRPSPQQNAVWCKERKEMFYLTTHSTHFIYGYMASYMQYPTERITHTTAVVTPVVEHWLEREIAQWVLFGGLHSLIWKQ